MYPKFGYLHKLTTGAVASRAEGSTYLTESWTARRTSAANHFGTSTGEIETT